MKADFKIAKRVVGIFIFLKLKTLSIELSVDACHS